jgi:hypothetical protein
MTHFSLDLETRKENDPSWLRIGAVVGRLVNDWSFRSDLVVTMGDSISHDHPALFNPASAEIEINTTKAFPNTSPEMVSNLQTRLGQLEHPVACGAIYHEALHARYSRFSLEKAFDELSGVEYKALQTLEEGRIESFGVKSMPENKVFLRSSAMELAIGDMDSVVENLSSVRGASFTAGLTLARVDAGVLEADEVEPIRELIVSVLGEDTLSQLREIWLEFQAHDIHADATQLYPLAKRWVEIVDKASKDAGETQQGEDGKQEQGEGSESGSSSEGSGNETGNSFAKQFSEALKEAVEEAREIVKISNQSEAFDAMDVEEALEEAKARAEVSKQQKKHKDVASEVFASSSGPGENCGTNSTLRETRTPTGEERAAAVKVAKLLEKAKYRERSQTEIRSFVPQGRLRSRAMVQNAAYKSMGLNHRVEAWERTVRKHTDDPELKVGVMVDISGSMGAAMNPLATTAWVLSEAGRRIQATTAMVYFGQDVFATLKPGQHLNAVNVYSAPDSTEEFDKGFQALDGSLNLLHSDGARLLVVVSDGHYRYEQSKKAAEWVKACRNNGVGVLWITFSGDDYTVKALAQHGAEVLSASPADGLGKVAELIGQKAADALSKQNR